MVKESFKLNPLSAKTIVPGLIQSNNPDVNVINPSLARHPYASDIKAIVP